MKPIIRCSKYVSSSLLLFLLMFGSFDAAAQTEAAGQIISHYGDIWISSTANRDWRKATDNTLLYNGYSIRTGRMSGVSLRMEDESLIRLSQNSVFVVEQLEVSSFWRRATALVSKATQSLKSTYRLLSGKLWGRNNNRHVNSTIRTTTATIGIRGTEYMVEASDESSQVTIMEGVVLASNAHGEATIRSGESASIGVNQAPLKLTTVKTRGSVQWTVLVPELMNVPALLEQAIGDNKIRRELITAYQQGRFADAYDRADQLLHSEQAVPALKPFLPWLLLRTGQTQMAQEMLQNLSTSDDSRTIQELMAFAAFLQNDLLSADLIIQQLENSHQLSDTGSLIKGYLAQSRHDLPGAQQAYLTALQINSNNLPARLQLATILFGSGDNERALHMVNLALDIDPNNVQALNLKGFIALAENDSSSALTLWQDVVKRNRANAETHFGLSLALMRKGEVEQAMQHIASAVLLDPQRSMYLSYWGKMLYQIGRHDRALTVLESAILKDPEDPTPHLYKSIILRDLNRPGESIESMQNARYLNNNRGVYRSRSLLDQDLAVQNVDLSRLYTQLGLNEWAHKSAIESIHQDYTNVSAHILNAGAYAQMGDRPYALFNEALLARLYQPANINAFSSYNSYTSLYEAPATQFDLALGAGNHDQFEASLFATGANPESRFAWAAGVVGDTSDGWRDNNGEDFSNLSLIGKWQLSRHDNLMLTLSSSKYEIKDEASARYEIDSVVDPYAKLEQATNQFEAGLLHRLQNQHDLMFYLACHQLETDFTDNNIDQVINVGGDDLTRERLLDGNYQRPYTQFQFQGVKQWPQHQLFYGVLAYDGKNKARLNSDYGLFDPNHSLLDNLPALDESSSDELDIQFTSLYVQDSWQLTDDLQLDLAVHAEQMDNANAVTGGEWRIDKVNGRAGIAWKFRPYHTLRLAHFEYILPFVTARLDPSNIAGITLFRSSSEGSQIRESDLVIDYEWAHGLVSTALFSVDVGSTTATPDGGGGQLESTSSSKKEGFSITYNHLLGERTGLNLALANFDQSDEAHPALERRETNLSLALTHVFANSLSITAKQIYRDLDFDTGSSYSDESINVTNLLLSYEFAAKTQAVAFEVTNLTDEEFNWVTDNYTTIGIAPARMYKLNYRISF